MILFWTTTEQPGSKLIRWGRNEDCSHFAINFFEAMGPRSFVVDSTLSDGVEITWRRTFLERVEVKHALYWGLPRSQEIEDYAALVQKIAGQEYDTDAVTWMSLWVLMEKLGGPGMRFNAWDRPNRQFCVEVAEVLLGEGYSHLTPHQLYEKLVQEDRFIDVSANYRKSA